MARTGAAWGIDLGQTALKALRCRPGDQPDRIIAEAFDYIEYPKMLSQPDANPPELIKEALEQFLSRNSVLGDRVAISVSGQSGLARFIKLPPVESKKIPDIVRYEARQQIPFALEDVVWDYQQMAGGSMEEGFALETEVGLFAMKRDQVNRALKPFIDAGIEVDIVQLTPLALYNFIAFDQLGESPQAEFDPENSPASTIVLSLGSDVSDLVVTNGFKVWQRTINLGGNHFTKALTKQMKLTFAKAEHLKRNAMKAEDPKAVFQAMRPVFGELLGEVQRSLAFFQNLERSAKLGRVVPLGNAMKLRGLHKYLSQNLGLEVSEFENYKQLDGPTVTSSPVFKENMLSYPVCYGLAVQALDKGKLGTNLLPPEIKKDRMIRAKKPWAVAAVAALLLGCMLGYFGKWREWNSAREDARFKQAFAAAKTAQDLSKSDESAYEDAKGKYEGVRNLGQAIAGIGEKRIAVAEMLKALTDCLPREEKENLDIPDRKELHIESVDMEYFPDLKVWFDDSKDLMVEAPKPAGKGAKGAPAEASGDAALDAGPSGPGYVVEVTGYHYHNKSKDTSGNFVQGSEFVRRTLMDNLKNPKKEIDLPGGKFTTKELGMGYPALTNYKPLKQPKSINDPRMEAGPGGGAPKGAAAGAGEVKVEQVDFTVRFAWKPTTQTERLENRKKEAQAKEAPHEVATAEGGGK